MAASLAEQDASGSFALPEGVESLSVDQQKTILDGLKNELAQLEALAPQGDASANTGKASEALTKSAADTAAQGAVAGGAMSAMSVLGKDSSPNAGFNDDNKDSKDQQLGEDQIAQLGNNKDHAIAGKGGQQFAVETPKAATADAQNNIQDVISQAQFLAKKGGGEMKVKMSPEGMGDVHLKVIVEKGQVNVEMIASNSEAKKLLERGIDELKANLVSHKLHVDQIKVGGSSDLSSQMQNQHSQEDGRNQSKFLQDFRDQNSAFRREIFDIGPARKPGSQILEDAGNAQFRAAAKKRTSGSRRLDLVA